MILDQIQEWFDEWSLKTVVIGIYGLYSLIFEIFLFYSIVHGHFKNGLKCVLMEIVIGIFLYVQLIFLGFIGRIFKIKR